MSIDISRIGIENGPVERSWSSDDALLYALAVGAGAEDNTAELAFTTENSEGFRQQVLPTFATLVGIGDPDLKAIGLTDMRGVVHGAQAIELFGPLPSAARCRQTTIVTSILDKGAGAVIEFETTTRELQIETPLMKTRTTLFARGSGGFGGERGPASVHCGPPNRRPDHVVTGQTARNQALLYRLTGDRNRLHSDPAYARLAGFPGPILHGLCSYGFVGRALLHALCGSDPARFHSMEARFSRPFMPGDALTTSVWRLDDRRAAFTATDSSGAAFITDGLCTFS